MSVFRHAYGCGCNKWKPLYDGCCHTGKSRQLCLNNKVKPITINGTKAPYAPPRLDFAENILFHHQTSNDDNKTYDKLPLVGLGIVSVIGVVLAIRIFGCVKAHRRKNSIKKAKDIVYFDVNRLNVHDV